MVTGACSQKRILRRWRDDSFIQAYGVAGTVDECVEQIEALGKSGVTQLTLTMLGESPEESIRLLGAASGG